MIDFEKELQAILRDDPLDILKTKPKESSAVSADNRLKASFEEVNQFINDHGHEPEKSRNINERRLFSRLKSIRENPEKAAMLLELDTHGLLKDVKFPEPISIDTVDDIFEADPLGLLASDNSEGEALEIFDLASLPVKSRASTDFVAKRKPCENFDDYKDRLTAVHKEISDGERRLLPFDGKGGEQLVEGCYYVITGMLMYLESIEYTSNAKTVDGKRFRKDGRTRCIFDNGTESNMKYRSLEKALYKGGKTVEEVVVVIF